MKVHRSPYSDEEVVCVPRVKELKEFLENIPDDVQLVDSFSGDGMHLLDYGEGEDRILEFFGGKCKTLEGD